MALCGPSFAHCGCHAELDQGKTMTKTEKWQYEYEQIAVTLIRLIEAGYLIVDKEKLDAEGKEY